MRNKVSIFGIFKIIFILFGKVVPSVPHDKETVAIVPSESVISAVIFTVSSVSGFAGFVKILEIADSCTKNSKRENPKEINVILFYNT